jgi:hypothetical protein
MDRPDEPERVALTVPLAAVGSSSSGRARLALAAWTITLAAIAWIGLAGHQREDEAPANVVPVAVIPVTAAAVATTAPAAATVSRGTVRYIAAPVASRHTLGEDGLVGRIVFGDHVPALSQADIERDGYRYFHALVAHDPGVLRQGPP